MRPDMITKRALVVLPFLPWMFVGCGSTAQLGAECPAGQAPLEGKCVILCTDSNPTTCGDDEACREGICTASVCGDGEIEGLETCDAASANSDSGKCTSNCQVNVCGDGFLLLGEEECDDGNIDDGDACSALCKPTRCGDGLLNLATETCDDGNTTASDGCDASCQIEAGYCCTGTCVTDGTINPDNACEVCDLSVSTGWTGPADSTDTDQDGTPDACDLCPGEDDTADSDNDGIPDACDTCADLDFDDSCDDVDNCLDLSNSDQADLDGDGVGDACDRCPGASDGADADGDGLPDGCEPTLNADLETNDVEGAQPTQFIEFDGALFFVASDGTQGAQWWRTDDSTLGARTISAGGTEYIALNKPADVATTSVGAFLFFVGRNTFTPEVRIYRTDGETALPVTQPFLEIEYLAAVSGSGGGVVFLATSVETPNASQLWFTDGTKAGTKVLAGSAIAGAAFPGVGFFAGINGTAYFTTSYQPDFGSRVTTLWTSNGTIAGTTKLDSSTLSNPKNPTYLKVLDSALYFSADTYNGDGKSMWRATGGAPLRLSAVAGNVAPIAKNAQGLFFVNMVYVQYVGTSYYLSVYNNKQTTALGYFKSFATLAQTATLRIPVGTTGLYDDLLVFSASATCVATYTPCATEFWVSNGTNDDSANTDGTRPLLTPQSDTGLYLDAQGLIAHDGAFYFTGSTEKPTVFAVSDLRTERALWRVPLSGLTDTAVMERVSTDAWVQGKGPAPRIYNGCLYFTSGDTKQAQELWRTDCVADAVKITERAINLNPSNGSSNPYSFARLGARVCFAAGKNSQCLADPNTGAGPFSLDGVSTTFVEDSEKQKLWYGAIVERVTNHASPLREYSVVQVDTLGGIIRVPMTTAPRKLFVVGGGVIIVTTATNSRPALDYVAAGTTETIRLLELPDTWAEEWTVDLLEFAGFAYLLLAQQNRTTLVRTDGTIAGTDILQSSFSGGTTPMPSTLQPNLARVGNTLFFRSYDGGSYDFGNPDNSVPGTGWELWKRSLTAVEAENLLVSDLRVEAQTTMFQPITRSSMPDTLTAFNDALYFVATGDEAGRRLWKTDGIIITEVPFPNSVDPVVDAKFLTVLPDRLCFAATGSLGRELYCVSKATGNGSLVLNISPTGNAAPKELVAMGDLLYFSAYTPTTGRELFRSDGTAAGTVMELNINLGATSADPVNLRVLGNELWFGATRNTLGREPWRLLRLP